MLIPAAGPPRGEPAFPAGLIPHLVNERLRTEPPYTPLNRRDIERTSVQPPPEPSPYIRSRIERFMAELQVRSEDAIMPRYGNMHCGSSSAGKPKDDCRHASPRPASNSSERLLAPEAGSGIADDLSAVCRRTGQA